MSRRFPGLMRRPETRDVVGNAADVFVEMPTTDMLSGIDFRQGVTLDGSDRISAITDLAGVADLGQATAGSRPGYEETGGPNGTPCGVFGTEAPSDDVHLLYDATILASAGPVTMYTICNPVAISGLHFFWDTATGRVALYFRSSKVGIYTTAYGDEGAATTGAVCVTFSLANAGGEVWLDRASAGTFTHTETAISGTTALGTTNAGTAGFDGRIAGHFIYDGAHDATARAAHWDVISSIWGVA